MNQPTAPPKNFRPMVDGERFEFGDIVQKPEGWEYITAAAALGVAYDSSRHFPCYRPTADKSEAAQ